MSRTRVTGEGVITGDGISGFASRSDLARMRELKRHGLEMSWYDDKNTEQNGLCSDCHRQETQRLGNGKRRPLGLGFDQNGQPNRLICTNCASKQRKARMEERNAPKDYDSLQAFWESNRATLLKEDPTEFARLKERHDYVSELYGAICNYVRGEDRCPEGLDDTLNETEADLVNHSTTDLDQLVIPFYKASHRHVYDEIQAAAEIPDAPKHARNCATFSRFGWLQALPVSVGNTYVREFLRKNSRWPYPDWSKPPNPIRTIKCATYQCKSEFTYNVNDKIPGWYFSTSINAVIPPAQWHCDKCRAEQAARKPSGRTLASVAPDRPFLVSGKLMTADTSAQLWFGRLPGE